MSRKRFRVENFPINNEHSQKNNEKMNDFQFIVVKIRYLEMIKLIF